jgi:hypothetical protein
MTDGPWWVDPLVTGASILVGAGMIVWQQRAANQSSLKLKLFEELGTGLSSASEAVSRAGMYAFMVPMHLRIYRDLIAHGQPAAIPTDRFPVFNNLHSKALESVGDLVSLLEAHDIVSEHFALFRQALACAHRDALDAFTAVTPVLVRALPMDLPNVPTPILPPLTEADVVKIGELCNRYWDQMSTISCYIHDIKIEAQNVLLRGLFRRRVPPRDPPDKRVWVLRTDDPDYLARVRRYFFSEHPVAAKGEELTNRLKFENRIGA